MSSGLMLLALCLTLVTAAASPSPDLVRCEFSVYAYQRLPGLYYESEGQLFPVTFYSSTPSPRYFYRGPSPLVFFRLQPIPNAEVPDAVRRIPVATADIPLAGGSFLLVFLVDPNTRPPLQYPVAVMPDDDRTFPAGSLRLFNATGWTLYGKLGADRFRLRPGSSPAFPIAASESLTLAFEHAGRLHRGFQQAIEVRPEERCLLLLFPPYVAGSARLQTRSLREPVTHEAGAEPAKAPQ